MRLIVQRCCVWIAVGLGMSLRGGEVAPGNRTWVEGVLPPPTFEVNPNPSSRGQAKPAAGLTLYSIGEPSEIEQEYLELLNRARLDPVGEGIRLRDTTDSDVRNAYYQENEDGSVRWSVDTNFFATVMSGISPVPPLAFNSKLIIAARGHTRWMFDNAVQVHDQPGLKPSQRVQNAGYDWSAVAENIFSYARSVYHGHAGFEVDWGEGSRGMQEPPGHRLNNHNAIFTEVGVGVLEGMNSVTINGHLSTVGPQVVTVDFGMPQAVVPLVTGVAYFDLNANGRYDAGEGIGGVRVEVSGSSYYAMTSSSGGYAVPSPAPRYRKARQSRSSCRHPSWRSQPNLAVPASTPRRSCSGATSGCKTGCGADSSHAPLPKHGDSAMSAVNPSYPQRPSRRLGKAGISQASGPSCQDCSYQNSGCVCCTVLSKICKASLRFTQILLRAPPLLAHSNRILPYPAKKGARSSLPLSHCFLPFFTISYGKSAVSSKVAHSPPTHLGSPSRERYHAKIVFTHPQGRAHLARMRQKPRRRRNHARFPSQTGHRNRQ